MNAMTNGTRISYKGKSGTIVTVALHGCAYINLDNNKRGNDGMILVKLDELQNEQQKGEVMDTYRVSLDGVATWFPCSGFLNGGETWNGFAQPIFTAEQLEIVAQWYESENIAEQYGQTFAENVTDLGHGEYCLYGWAFSLDA
jgi:hypothetical protein